MQSAAVRGVKLVYEVLGDSGPSSRSWVAMGLAFNYYRQFIEHGGLDAVVKTEHFRAMVAANPAHRKILEGLSAEAFLAPMKRWLAGWLPPGKRPSGRRPHKVAPVDGQ